MGFSLKVNGVTVDSKNIQKIEYLYETAKDSNAKTTDVAVTIKVTGKILASIGGESDATKDLAAWAAVPAEQTDCYRDVKVNYVSAGMVVRDISLPNAFVVDYKESFIDESGVGQFEIIIRQKKDMIKNIVVTGSFGA